MGTASFQEPVSQGDQIPCHCPKALQFFLPMSRLYPAETSNNEVIMDVNPTATWIKNFHFVSSSASLFICQRFSKIPCEVPFLRIFFCVLRIASDKGWFTQAPWDILTTASSTALT
jgi:hypothetical protein